MVRSRSRYSSMSRFTNFVGEAAAAVRYSGRSRSMTRSTVPGVSQVEICETRDETLIDT